MMFELLVVLMIDHRGERRRLARARRARHEHHALVQVAELVEQRRQPRLSKRQDDTRDVPERCADSCRLVKHVDAKAPAVAADVREVDVVFLPEALALRVGQDLVDVTLELGVSQVAELDRHEVAVQPQHRRHADGEVNVRAALREPQLQECVDACHAFTLRRARSFSATRSSSMDA